jgi:hypothetical protein
MLLFRQSGNKLDMLLKMATTAREFWSGAWKSIWMLSGATITLAHMTYYNRRYGGREIYPGYTMERYTGEQVFWYPVGGAILGPLVLAVILAQTQGIRMRIKDRKRNKRNAEYEKSKNPIPRPYPHEE